MDRDEFMDIVYDLLKDDTDNNRANSIIDAADEYAESMTPTWIPVDEAIPVNSSQVIIAHKRGVSTGWHNGRYWERGASSNHRRLKTVTHWMPFPEAPKGE